LLLAVLGDESVALRPDCCLLAGSAAQTSASLVDRRQHAAQARRVGRHAHRDPALGGLLQAGDD
jgi:hypothetical protein